MFENDISIKTEQFDGPLSLLLHLIQKEEMDVRNLNVTYITAQYLDYLNQMRNLNFDMAGDYLYMAATLLYLKSETCLLEREKIGPLIEGEENPIGISSKAELINRLQQLQHFQQMGLKLWALPKKGHDVFTRPKVDRKQIINSILMPMDLNSLMLAQMELMMKEKKKFTIMKRDRLSIKEKLNFLKKYLNVGMPTNLVEILEADRKDEKDEIQNKVITFISLLELARLKKISIYQNEDFQNIYIEVLTSLEDFNVDLADGFAEEGAAGEKSESELDASKNSDLAVSVSQVNLHENQVDQADQIGQVNQVDDEEKVKLHLIQ